MIYFAIAVTALLFAANLGWTRNPLYPPVLFTGVWLATLLGFAVAGDMFYDVSDLAFGVFALGALAFSAGGFLALTTQPPSYAQFPESDPSTVRLLNVLVLALPLFLPLLWTADFSQGEAMAEARQLAIESSASSEREFRILPNIVVLSTFLAFVMAVENDGSLKGRMRLLASVVLATAFGMTTGSKSVVRMIFGLLFISAMKMKKLTVRHVAISVTLVVALFTAGLVMVNFWYMNFDVSADSAYMIFETMMNYWLGSLVAFDQLDGNEEVNHFLTRFFVETANGLGASYYIPSVHAPFAAIGGNMASNTYTIYYSYFIDYGWLGVILGMATIGFISTKIYSAAYRSRIALAVYGFACIGIVFSVQAEMFWLALNSYIKLVIFLLLAYHAMPTLAAMRTRMLASRRRA